MNRYLAILLSAILIIVGCVNRAESKTVPLWGRFETQVENTNRYAGEPGAWCWPADC